MNQETYQEYFRRLPENEPLRICRICVQETENLVASSDQEFSDIRNSYEEITELKEAQHRYFLCTECINMLREIQEFQDMLRLSDMFWKKYVSKEPSNNKQPKNEPLIEFAGGDTLNQIYCESVKLESDDVTVEQSCNEHTSESDDSDIAMNGIEVDFNAFTTVVDLKIESSCDICDAEFSSKELFEKHITAHERSFNCAHCGISFRFKPSVLLHLKQIHSEGVATNPYKWICTSCDNLELSSKLSLRTHIQQYHGPEDEAKCPECKKTFGNLKKLVWHMSQHREKPYQCTKCTRKYKNKHFLDKHSATHSNGRSFVCELCGLGLLTNRGLKRHILGVHEMIKQKKYRRSIECTLCEVIFTNLTQSKEHFHSKHSEADWKEFRSLCCGVCYIRFESTAKRQEHYSQYQANHDKSIKKLGPRNYVSRTQRERPHQCDICMNTFRTPDTLKGHMKMHHKKPRPFKCEICGAKHAAAFDLRLHILRAHTEDRPHSCSECDYKCVTRRELNNHNKWNHTAK